MIIVVLSRLSVSFNVTLFTTPELHNIAKLKDYTEIKLYIFTIILYFLSRCLLFSRIWKKIIEG